MKLDNKYVRNFFQELVQPIWFVAFFSVLTTEINIVKVLIYRRYEDRKSDPLK